MEEALFAHHLLMRLQGGDDQAIETLYTHYAGRFYHFAIQRYHLSPEDADDAVQITFCRLLEKIATYNEHLTTGEGWIYAICRNASIDMLRERRHLDGVDVEVVDERLSPEELIVKQDHFEEITRAWNKLPERDHRDLVRGRGRGPGRKAWHEAIQRFRQAIASEEYPYDT